MKKSILKSSIAIIFATLICASCVSGEKPIDSTSVKPSGNQEVEVDTNQASEIVWAGWSGEEEGAKEIFKEMKDTFSGGKVSWIGWPWGDVAQQLLIRSQGKEKLDIAQVDISIFATVAKSGILTDLNDVFGSDYLKSNFDESILEVGNVDGKQLAIPWSMASISMVYNPELIAKAGWDKPPVTIEEFEKCLADVSKLDNTIIPYGVATKDSTAAGDFAPWLWTFGGSTYDDSGNVVVNSEKAVNCVDWYKGLLKNNYIRMDISRFDARQLFAQGKIAFYDDAVLAKGVAVGNGISPDDVNSVCRAMLRPVLNVGDTPQSVMWGHMLVIFDDSTVKEDAANFAKHLVSEDIALKYFKSNGMPPTLKSVVSSPEVANDDYLNGFLESSKTGRLEETARMANGGEIKTIITEELQAALLENKTSQKALDDMASRISSVH